MVKLKIRQCQCQRPCKFQFLVLQQYCALVIGDGMNESKLLESEAMII